jgi:hypothetical protein
MLGSNNKDDLSPKEVQERFEAALKGAMNTSPKPLKEKPKKKKSPREAKKKNARKS